MFYWGWNKVQIFLKYDFQTLKLLNAVNSNKYSILYVLFRSCLPGYNGTNCELACPTNTYGTNCLQQCSCKNNATCSRIDGTCDCTAGWTGKSCDQSCTEGLYGKNCRLVCLCSKYGICDPFTGACKCFGEYQGVNCTKSKLLHVLMK